MFLSFLLLAVPFPITTRDSNTSPNTIRTQNPSLLRSQGSNPLTEALCLDSSGRATLLSAGPGLALSQVKGEKRGGLDQTLNLTPKEKRKAPGWQSARLYCHNHTHDEHTYRHGANYPIPDVVLTVIDPPLSTL